ncbi:hypothetical protein CPB86DRAFT_878093 [Serendipita vermifera]|nr:hypothetical protein CPB86DRAFT_878093 [Serendipita vermifera]
MDSFEHKRLRAIHRKTDSEVWHHPDQEIIDSALVSWQSDAYDHYNVSLSRDRAKREIHFIFTCKTNTLHEPITRPRRGRSDVAWYLQKGIECCSPDGESTPTQKTSSTSHGPYSARNHRLIIARQCAVLGRSVEEPLYREEVECLRPGTHLPDKETVLKDIERLNSFITRSAKAYFQSQSCIHLIVDGWNNSHKGFLLEISFIWYSDSKIHSAIMDVLQSKSTRDASYIASKLQGCLLRYNVMEKLYGVCICMNDRSLNDKIAKDLERSLKEKAPNWSGVAYHIPCIPNLLGLMGQPFISFFFPRVEATRQIKAKEGTPMEWKSDSHHEITNKEPTNLDGHTNGPNTWVSYISRVSTRAFDICRNSQGIVATSEDEILARNLFTKFDNLAKAVQGNGNLQVKWKAMKSCDYKLEGQRLQRWAPTRQNPGYDWLDGWLSLELHISDLLEDEDVDELQNYNLTPQDWELAKHISQGLAMFDDAAQKCSLASGPVVSDVLQVLGDLEYGLGVYQADIGKPAITRVAAQAAIEMASVLREHLAKCVFFNMAILLHPSKKSEWMQDNQRKSDEIEDAKRLTLAEFNRRYPPPSPNEPSSTFSQIAKATDGRNHYVNLTHRRRDPASPRDSLESFWSEPPVEIKDGSLWEYLETQREERPRLTRFQLDILSIPCSFLATDFKCPIVRISSIGGPDEQVPEVARTLHLAFSCWENQQPFMPARQALCDALNSTKRSTEDKEGGSKSKKRRIE